MRLRGPVICLLLGISCTVPGAEMAPTVSAGQVGGNATRIVMLGTRTPGAAPTRPGPATPPAAGALALITAFAHQQVNIDVANPGFLELHIDNSDSARTRLTGKQVAIRVDLPTHDDDLVPFAVCHLVLVVM